jgi:transcriptional regulator with XRE-family HTH domain
MEFDREERKHIIAWLLRAVRGRQIDGRSQGDIAGKAGVSQSALSAWESYGDERSFGRESLKRILTLGLNLPSSEVDGLLWFAQPLWQKDGDILTPGEVADLITSAYDPNTRYVERVESDLRRGLFQAVRSAASDRHLESTLEIFTADFAGRTALEDALLRLQDVDRPRVAVTTIPPFPARPWHVQERVHSVLMERDEPATKRILGLLRKRYDAWETWVKEHSFRVIVAKEAIERYFSKDPSPNAGLTFKDRRQEAHRWLQLLMTNDNYQVAVESRPLLMNYQMVGVSGFLALVDAPLAAPAFTGIRGILARGPLSLIVRLRLEYERQWLSIPDRYKNKKEVIAWIAGVADIG